MTNTQALFPTATLLAAIVAGTALAQARLFQTPGACDRAWWKGGCSDFSR